VTSLRTLAARLLKDALGVWVTAFGDLPLAHRSTALLVFMIFVGISGAAALTWSLSRRRPGTARVVVPALLDQTRRAWTSPVRHAPMLIFIAGVPLFMFALADPYAIVVEQRVTYPGRRIALLVDASSSMLKPFGAGRLNARSALQSAFFTSVGAADAFIRQRQRGQYRDLMALLEFGDEAYVVTPFTNDYDNVLLSASLIGDWSEFIRFPNQGTRIAAAIDEATRLFTTFGFVRAAGNLMIIFSDGEDTQLSANGRPLAAILASAVTTRIPVYLIRTNRDKALGDIVPDALWKRAVEQTGGRFYAAANESDVLRAIDDIDRRSPGTIEVKQYSGNQPRFAPFATVAAGLWSVALLLTLTFRTFTKFP
jgi:hypothetical protein